MSHQSSTRKNPVDLADLEKVARLKAEEDAKNSLKPVYLTKKQRQELALKRLEARKQEEQAKRAQLERQRQDFELQSKASKSSSGNYRGRSGSKRSRHDERSRSKRSRNDEEKSQTSESGTDGGSAMNESMLSAIKERYLGKKKKERKVVPPSQKFKFHFGWDASEDTSQDINPLYQQRHNASLLYGRGFVGGVDRREQIKKNKFYNDLVAKRSVAIGDQRVASRVEERKQRSRKRDLATRLTNRHWKEKELSEMEERDWRIMREDYNIGTRGVAVPKPLRFWREANFPSKIVETLDRVGYKEPTPIQRAAIPVGLSNRDCVGIAVTGSGKTAAFVLPMLVYIDGLPRLSTSPDLAALGPYAIILAPTRELAQQIETEVKKFAEPLGIKCTSIVGGMSIQNQGFLVRLGVEVIIATPGRLFDCIERRYLVLNQCNYIVLDEADTMIDMNFEPQIMRIMDTMPSTNLRPESVDELLSSSSSSRVYRQTFMFSATMPPAVEKLSSNYLRNPVHVAIGDRTGGASSQVEQRVEMLNEGAKRSRLLAVLKLTEPPIIVFCNTKQSCDGLVRYLKSSAISATSLHGGKTQEQRMERLAQFKDGHFDVLVATDVLGRGIDISGVTLVVNYDMASTIERYTHRVGRTGRAGAKGLAVTFLTDSDSDLFLDLIKQLKTSGNTVPPELMSHPAAHKEPGSMSQQKKKKPRHN